MTRREFLWTVALGVGACEGRRIVSESRAEAGGTMDPGFAIQRAPSPLVFTGGRLVELGLGGVVRVRDGRSLAVVAELPYRAPVAVGALAGGALAVLVDVDRNDPRAPRLFRHDLASGASRGWLVAAGKSARLLGTEVENEVWIAEPSGAVRWALEEGGATRIVAVVEWGRDGFDTAVALADGSLLGATSGGLSRYRPGRPPVRYAADAVVWHAAAGADAEHVWVTDRLDELALVRLGDPCRIERRFPLAPAKSVHMHASGGLAAVLLVDTRPDAPDGAPSHSLAVFDAERERMRVSTPIGDSRRPFVALSAERVVLLAAPGSLQGWDLATGKKILG